MLVAAGVLGGERTLQLLTEPLAAMSNGSSAAFDSRTAEAALYCVRAVHRWRRPAAYFKEASGAQCQAFCPHV